MDAHCFQSATFLLVHSLRGVFIPVGVCVFVESTAECCRCDLSLSLADEIVHVFSSCVHVGLVTSMRCLLNLSDV